VTDPRTVITETSRFQLVEEIDRWLDRETADPSIIQPLAQDWARVAKVSEEAGEVISVLIGVTGQNPRKGVSDTRSHLLQELADTAWTAIFAIQHFTKDTDRTRGILDGDLLRIHDRMVMWYEDSEPGSTRAEQQLQHRYRHNPVSGLG
jgi:hypothetical protein